MPVRMRTVIQLIRTNHERWRLWNDIMHSRGDKRADYKDQMCSWRLLEGEKGQVRNQIMGRSSWKVDLGFLVEWRRDICGKLLWLSEGPLCIAAHMVLLESPGQPPVHAPCMHAHANVCPQQDKIWNQKIKGSHALRQILPSGGASVTHSHCKSVGRVSHGSLFESLILIFEVPFNFHDSHLYLFDLRGFERQIDGSNRRYGICEMWVDLLSVDATRSKNGLPEVTARVPRQDFCKFDKFWLCTNRDTYLSRLCRTCKMPLLTQCWLCWDGPVELGFPENFPQVSWFWTFFEFS